MPPSSDVSDGMRQVEGAFEKAWGDPDAAKDLNIWASDRGIALHFWNAALAAAKAGMPEGKGSSNEYNCGWTHCADLADDRLSTLQAPPSRPTTGAQR